LRAGLHPAVRGNTDISFCFGLKSQSEKAAFAEQYLDMIPKAQAYAVLQDFIGREGEQRHFIAVDNRNINDVPEEDCVYQGYAEQTPDFIMGSREYWGDELEPHHAKMLEAHRELHHPEDVFGHIKRHGNYR
jgi:hypothetical protein